MTSDSILKLIADCNYTEARAAIDQMLADAADAASRAEAYYLRGRVAWKEGKRGEAISCYEKAESLDPESPAVVALEQTRSIMEFYNKDLYNP